MLAQEQGALDNSAERRALRRFRLKLPASVRVSGIPYEFPTETENISAQGLFFHIDRWMKEGASVEVTMQFPTEVVVADPVEVKFKARVVRIEPDGGGTRTGVAVVIEHHEFQHLPLSPQPLGTTSSNSPSPA